MEQLPSGGRRHHETVQQLSGSGCRPRSRSRHHASSGQHRGRGRRPGQVPARSARHGDERPHGRVEPARGEAVGVVRGRHKLGRRRGAMPRGRKDLRLRRRRWRCGGTVVQFTGVLLEVEISTEALAAGGTRKRFAILVRVHVKRQVVDLMKRLRTYLYCIHGDHINNHYAINQPTRKQKIYFFRRLNPITAGLAS